MPSVHDGSPESAGATVTLRPARADASRRSRCGPSFDASSTAPLSLTKYLFHRKVRTQRPSIGKEQHMIDFTGQVAIVTGAGRGLGRLYATELARRGASVVVNDLGGTMGGEGHDAAVADEVVAEITADGGAAVGSHDSVASPE